MRGAWGVIAACMIAGCDFDAGYRQFKLNADILDASFMCPASSETNACYKCTDEHCCREYDRCHGDARCTDYYQKCLPGCRADGGTYDQCVVSCHKSNNAGHALFAPYFACGEQHCLSECANGAPDPCIVCAMMQCPDAWSACSADSNCDAMSSCWAACEGRADQDACRATCRQSYPKASVDAFDLRNSCAVGACMQSCL